MPSPHGIRSYRVSDVASSQPARRRSPRQMEPIHVDGLVELGVAVVPAVVGEAEDGAVGELEAAQVVLNRGGGGGPRAVLKGSTLQAAGETARQSLAPTSCRRQAG